MFIYESKKVTNGNEVEVLNVVFQSTQLPVETPDVQVWRDGNTVHAKIGNNEITGTVQ